MPLKVLERRLKALNQNSNSSPESVQHSSPESVQHTSPESVQDTSPEIVQESSLTSVRNSPTSSRGINEMLKRLRGHTAKETSGKVLQKLSDGSKKTYNELLEEVANYEKQVDQEYHGFNSNTLVDLKKKFKNMKCIIIKELPDLRYDIDALFRDIYKRICEVNNKLTNTEHTCENQDYDDMCSSGGKSKKRRIKKSKKTMRNTYRNRRTRK